MKRKYATRLLVSAVTASMLISPAMNVFAAGNPDPKDHETTKSANLAEGQDNVLRYSYSTIDYTKTGTISIYKYEENDGTMSEGDGQIDETVTREGVRRPIQGIQFKGLKIADVKNITGTVTDGPGHGTETVGAYYINVDKRFEDLLTKYGITLGSVNIKPKNTQEQINDVHTAKQMETALKALTDAQTPSGSHDTEQPGKVGVEGNMSGTDAVESLMKGDDVVTFADTDANGYTHADGLKLGLYLIAETDYNPSAALGKTENEAPVNNVSQGRDSQTNAKQETGNEHVTGDSTQNHQDIDVSTVPYLVSVPMTNVTAIKDGNTTVAAGTAWMYDIVSYPKNQTTNVVKKIIDPDGKDAKKLEDYEDYSIGDVVKQTIFADAPANMHLQGTGLNASGRADKDPDNYTIFALSDEMQKGLKFVNYGEISTNKTAPDNVKVYLGNKKGHENDKSEEALQKDMGLLTRAKLSGEKLTDGDYVILKTPVQPADIDENDSLSNVYTKLDQALAKSMLTDGNVPDNNNAQDFCIQLTSHGIEKLNNAPQEQMVAVFFDSQVTPSAKIGTADKNTNQAKLTTKHQQGYTHEKYSNETRVFTYELDLTKKADESEDVFSPENSIFTVKQTKHDGDGNASETRNGSTEYNIVQADNAQVPDLQGTSAEKAYIDKMDGQETDWEDTGLVRFVQEEPGVYHVYAAATDKADTATTLISPAHDGKLILKGLDSAEYTITERHTQDHFSLMKDSFKVDLKAATKADEGNYTSDYANGKAADNMNVNRQALNGLRDEHVTGALVGDDAITTDGTTLDLPLSDGNKGIGSLTVMNDKVITLRTGGKGMIAFYFGAAGLGAAVIIGYVYSKRKKEQTEQ